GTLDWRDDFRATASQTIPFRTKFQDMTADATWVHHTLRYQVQLHDGPTWLAATGQHQLSAGTGHCTLRVSNLDIAKWANYGAANDSYKLTRGEANIVAGIRYGAASRDPLRVAGTVMLSDAGLTYQGVHAPIEHVGGIIGFDQRRIRVEDITGDILGNAFSARGAIDLPPAATPGADAQLHLDVAAPRIDLGTTPRLVAALAAFGPAGTGSGTAKVTGGASDPVIAVQAKIDRAVLLKEAIGPATAQVRIHSGRADVRDIRAAIAGGNADGNLTMTFDAHPQAKGQFTFGGARVYTLVAALLPKPLPLQGLADGTVSVQGPLTDIDVRGSAKVRDGSYGKQRIASSDVAFRVYRGDITLPAVAIALAGGGVVDVSGELDRSGDLSLQGAARDVDLAGLRRAGFGVDVAGTASGSFRLTGPLAHPDEWDISGNLTARDGTAYGQPVKDISGDFRVADGGITLANVAGESAGARVLGSGQIAPISFERTGIVPDVRLRVAIRDADLLKIFPLQEWASPSVGTLAGHATLLDGHIDVVHGALGLSGSLVASSPSAMQIGELTSAMGHFDWHGRRLELTGARLFARRSEVDVDGSVNLANGDPAYDLHVRTTGGDAKSLLAAPAWQALLQGGWLGGSQRPVNPGVQRRYAELPDRVGVALSPSPPLNLTPIYLHWLHYAEPPMTDSDIFLVSRFPFWKAIDGKLDADVRLAGTLQRPAIWSRIQFSNGSAYGHALDRVTLSGELRGEELDIGQFDLQAADGGVVHLQGGLGAGRQLIATVNDFDLSWLDPLLTAQQLRLGGRLAGRVVMSGDLANPKVDITASAQSGSVDDFAFDRATAAGTLENGVLDIAQAAIGKDGKQATLSGTVPIGARPEVAPLDLSIDVEGDSLGIVSVLTHRAVTWQGGEGMLKVKVLGTEAEPRLAGGLELRGATIGVAGLSDPLTDVDARVLLGTGIAKVEEASATYGGGHLDAAGYVTLDRFQPLQYNLQVTAKGVLFKLANKLWEGKTEASLHVGGDFARPALSGIVAVSDGTITLPLPTGPGGASSLPIDLDNVVLSFGNSVRVYQANLMSVYIGGNLFLNGSLSSPRPRGMISILPAGST
ncbi:MAG: translocation/assembly module TamB domain-containing protein, partial [Cyanobacteria bacterium REEB65]|nr:translocation/assembly module TamB domain-containing protein [Cyanobacteria bacterium REEB65]